jgi:hypothetical protein
VDRHVTVFEATRNGRVLHIEDVGDPVLRRQHDLVVALRERDGFALPLPGWDADDDAGLVVLCREGDRALATVRLVERHPGDGQE